MPMDDKLDCRISRVKAAKFPQIQIKIFQQRTRRCVRARSSRPASTLTSAAGYRRAHFVRICLDLCTSTRLAWLLGIELPLHRPPSAANRSCTDAISGDANGKADSICRPLHPSNRRTPMTSVQNVNEMQDALKDALKTHWKLFLAGD